jgi:hypothetical protein
MELRTYGGSVLDEEWKLRRLLLPSLPLLRYRRRRHENTVRRLVVTV